VTAQLDACSTNVVVGKQEMVGAIDAYAMSRAHYQQAEGGGYAEDFFAWQRRGQWYRNVSTTPAMKRFADSSSGKRHQNHRLALRRRYDLSQISSDTRLKSPT